MNTKKEKLSTPNKQLIYRINDLAFGMHGHLTILLKNLQCYVNFKKHKEDAMANLYLQCVFLQLNHIKVLFELIIELGGNCKIYDYKSNQIEYYKLNEKRKIFKSEAILDSIANQSLLLKKYLEVKRLTCDKKVNDIIDKIMGEMNKELEFLSEKLTNNSTK